MTDRETETTRLTPTLYPPTSRKMGYPLAANGGDVDVDVDVDVDGYANEQRNQLAMKKIEVDVDHMSAAQQRRRHVRERTRGVLRGRAGKGRWGWVSTKVELAAIPLRLTPP